MTRRKAVRPSKAGRRAPKRRRRAARGKINFVDLADLLAAILIYHETYDDPSLDVRGRADRRRRPGGFSVPVRVEIIELAILAAQIAAGEVRRPDGRPPMPKKEWARLRGVAVKELLGPRYKREAALEVFAKLGVGRTSAQEYLKAGRELIAEWNASVSGNQAEDGEMIERDRKKAATTKRRKQRPSNARWYRLDDNTVRARFEHVEDDGSITRGDAFHTLVPGETYDDDTGTITGKPEP